ncbi:YciI family protein [Mesorhizobium shangrilense]|uniref:YciI family protein n=1 Tax=Mesorhizobium shangrilense TaxID=460060 RepID=A0ABV2DS23_9HYPH
MQYMALIYSDPSLEPAYGSPEFEAMMKDYFAFDKALRAAGAHVAGEELTGVETATSLKIRNGKVETMDGPFAETKERLGGFYIFDVPDLDAALRFAAMIPSAPYGTIEVRPVMKHNS